MVNFELFDQPSTFRIDLNFFVFELIEGVVVTFRIHLNFFCYCSLGTHGHL